MRPGKGLFKVASWVLGITTLLAFLPANVSAHPLDLSGVGRFGNKVTAIAGDIGKTLSELKTNLAADVQKITTSTTTTKPPPVTPESVQKITSDVDPDKDNMIKSPSGKIMLTVPKGAISKASQIEFTEYPYEASSGMVMLNRFTLTAKDKVSGADFSKFSQNLQITIQHSPQDIAGVDPASIRLYYQDEKTKQWVPVANSKFDPATNTLTGTTDHFTNYGEQGNSLIVGPGVVTAAQVGLHSGSATFSYPFELPPGPGGFKPKLNLVYDSASVDEMKDKRDVGSWVGIGWSLDFGCINYNASANSYCLEMNGVSYQLVCTDQTQLNYRTNPEEYFKITRNGNTWNVYDKDGNYYRFGGTSDSQQYLNTTYYRWDLSLIQDANGNQATINYLQDIKGSAPYSWVRSAYPSTLTYGNTQVSLISAYDVNDPTDGILRNDDPKTYTYVTAPKIMENRYLSSIEVRFAGILIRKYNLTYNVTNTVYSYDYGGIYYAGTMSLASLTQVGANGSSQLPSMNFTYQNLQTYYYDSTHQTYSGNPGNQAMFSWPHLTVVSNGYGGSTAFSYNQIPGSTPQNIWTREAVIQKTVVDGISPNQTTQYTYAGNPQYKDTGWAAQFRGWNQVTETNAASNYVTHYFYTTGTINGNDAEKLTGKEYHTQWYNSSGSLLDTKNYSWNWTQTGQYTGLPYIQLTPTLLVVS